MAVTDSLFGGAPPVLNFNNALQAGGITVCTLGQTLLSNGTIVGIRRYRSLTAPTFEIGSLWSRTTDAAGVQLATSQAWVGTGGGLVGAAGWDYTPMSVPVTVGQKLYAGLTADRFVSATTNSPLLTASVNSPGGYLVAPQNDAITPQINGRFNTAVSAVPLYPNTGSGNCYWVDFLFEPDSTCPPCPPCPPNEGFFINLTSPGFAAVVTGVGNCVVEALDQTPAGAPCRQCLLLPTMQIPWDNCGPCVPSADCPAPGQVALAIREVYGSKTFPQPANGVSWRKCQHYYEIARVVVSVTRCVPTMDAKGIPPDCPAELAAAIILENDRTAVRQAIACCLAEANRATPWLVSEWVINSSVTVGELGGCAGTETEVLIGARSCLCPD